MTPIVRLISKYAKPTIYSDGAELAIPCPYCRSKDGRKKLWINVNKRLFICYKCDERGTARRLLAKLRLIKPEAFEDVPREVMDAFCEAPEAPIGPIEHPGYRASLPAEFEPLWPADKVKGSIGKNALKYLHGRGLDDDAIELYRLGFCQSGRYAYRIIIPTYEDTRMVYWISRDFTGQQDPKVLNPEKALCGVGSKEWVFNLNIAEDFQTLIVCEGVFSAIAAGLNAVALFGKTASEIQISKIRHIRFETIIVLLDADAPVDADKLAYKLRISPPPATRPVVKIGRLPEGDPNSVTAKVLSQTLLSAESALVEL